MSRRLVLATLALLLALGLPWGVVGPESEYVPGWMTPSFCTVDADGWMSCTPGFVSPGMTFAGQGAAYAGFQTSARVTIVLGLVLIALWARQGTVAAGAWQLRAAAVLQIVAVALAGSALRAGAIAALIAAVLLLMEAGWPRPAPGVPTTPTGRLV